MIKRTIKRTTSFTDSNGRVYATLEQAQQAELESFLKEVAAPDSTEVDIVRAAEILVQEKDRVTDILTTTLNSRPAARRVNGGRKERKNKTPAGDLPLNNSAP